jgi:DNA/RNA-binding domain of Phe-tRNA-synthetase-like protein
MEIKVTWQPHVTTKFPELAICIGLIKDIQNERENETLRKLERDVYEEVRAKYDIETLKDNVTVRAYRDFYWKLDIDPTKTRPSGEALLRRVLHGDELPNISTVVDAYNLASLKTIVPISGFDPDLLTMSFQVRFAKNEETFTGIGMTKPMTLTEKMLVLADAKQTVCVYPYRDSDATKITLNSRKVLIIAYGAPGISNDYLKQAAESTLAYIKLVSGGTVETATVFNTNQQ